MSLDRDNILEHYGVKGMRWGVRRTEKQLRLASQGGAEAKKLGKKTRYKGNVRHISDEELARRIKRLEMEKRYMDLNSRDVSTGEALAVDVLTTVGKDTAKSTLTGLGKVGVREALEKQAPGLGKAAFPKIKFDKKKKK